MGFVAAVDLGGSSGRVVVGEADAAKLSLHPVARFPTERVTRRVGGHESLLWQIDELYEHVLAGVDAALREAPQLISLGIDSWGVDYGLIRGGTLLELPHHYRDDRTRDAIAWVHRSVPPETLYRQNGLQFLPFNTLYQLTADRLVGQLGTAERMLLIPDLLTYWLTGEQVAERTNASTTGLLDFSGQWNRPLIDTLSLPPELFPELVNPGIPIGELQPSLHAGTGLGRSVTVTAVGSHDTASAVVGVPMRADHAAYISCGTWSLIGVELEHPVVTDAARRANFTNERGVDGRVLFLRNVMGMWILNEAIRQWCDDDTTMPLDQILAQAAQIDSPVPIFDVNDTRFLTPGRMDARIMSWFGEREMPYPSTLPQIVRSVLESLAVSYASTLQEAEDLSGVPIQAVHLVGGGSQNELLCQLTADRTGHPLLAGPVEATAIGNILIQARSFGFVNGDLETLRALIAAHFPSRVYKPRGAVPR